MVQHTSCLQCCPLWLPVCEWLWLYMPPDVQQRAGMSGLAPGVVLGRTGPGASPIVSGWKIPSTAPTTAHVPLPRKPLLLWLGSLRLPWSTCCALTPAQCHGRRLQKASPTLKSPPPHTPHPPAHTSASPAHFSAMRRCSRHVQPLAPVASFWCKLLSTPMRSQATTLCLQLLSWALMLTSKHDAGLWQRNCCHQRLQAAVKSLCNLGPTLLVSVSRQRLLWDVTCSVALCHCVGIPLTAQRHFLSCRVTDDVLKLQQHLTNDQSCLLTQACEVLLGLFLFLCYA